MKKRAGKRKEENNFNLKKEYKKSWDYLKKSKKFILMVVVIFFTFALIGFFLPVPDSIVEQIMKFITEVLEKTQRMSPNELIGFIFFNNLKSSFFGMILGIFLGVFPVIGTIANGYLLGFVSAMSVEAGGILTLWRLLPHGIFELPAVFISLGLGLKLGTIIFKEKKLEKFKDYLLGSLRVFLLVVVPLLVIAGVIEGLLIAFVN